MNKFYFQKGTEKSEKVKAFHGGSGYIIQERIFSNHNIPLAVARWKLC